MKKTIYFVYGIVCYGIFFLTFLYLIGFVENISAYAIAAPIKNLFPTTLDTGTTNLPLGGAILIDLLLIALFGIQHSVMARQSFKEKWTKIVPPALERSTFVLFTSIILIVMFLFWQPMNLVLWNFSQTITGSVFLSLSVLGWVLLLITTFLINHFDLFGLRQVYLYARNKKVGHISFRTPGFYNIIRHPIYFSFLLAFWFAPIMTLAHLVFNIGMTVYIFIGIYHEEKDLVKLFGERYEDYRLQVPKIIPFSGSGKKAGFTSGTNAETNEQSLVQKVTSE